MAGLPPASESALPLFESVTQLIEQVAARQPLVLVLEDLHWADEMSLRLLAFVGRRIPAWTALLIATAREEELTDASMARQTLGELSRAPQAMPVMLAPLSRPDIALLVRARTRAGSDALTVAQVEKRILGHERGQSVRRRGGDTRPRPEQPVGWRPSRIPARRPCPRACVTSSPGDWTA